MTCDHTAAVAETRIGEAGKTSGQTDLARNDHRYHVWLTCPCGWGQVYLVSIPELDQYRRDDPQCYSV